MDFDKIRDVAKNVEREALRYDCPTHFEAVIVKEEMGKFIAQLDGFFGSPVFPSNTKLSPEIKQVIEEFGGIMSGQTLYYSRQEDGVILAMLWPWKDRQRTTVKIIKKSTSGPT
jgi:hypothetical protein